jgi:hypothetical protein
MDVSSGGLLVMVVTSCIFSYNPRIMNKFFVLQLKHSSSLILNAARLCGSVL